MDIVARGRDASDGQIRIFDKEEMCGMGLPRNLKGYFFYVLCSSGLLLVILNLLQDEIWHRMRPHSAQPQSARISDNAKVSNLTGTTILSRNTIESSDPSKRPWYMKGGTRRPYPAIKSHRTGRRLARLWPDEDAYDDRVTNQLMYVPTDYNKSNVDTRPKKIMVPHGMPEAKVGPDIFLQHRCPVNTCTIVRDNPEEADLILFKDYITHVGRRTPNQVWMLYFLECPYHTQSVKNAIINWTATYRRDSDIVAPYERWQYYDPSVTQIPQTFNYAANKTKKVAWFVSNCHPRNQRMQYAKELSKYIQVDIYGTCGTLRCPRSQSQACFEMLDEDYKFYLAFENSNCKDYITEKFFVNGLGYALLFNHTLVENLVEYIEGAPAKWYHSNIFSISYCTNNSVYTDYKIFQ